MANIISITSVDNNSGKTTIAFNLINVMPSNLKILLIELDYASTF
jgi:cellulose biosynthesis protein BcsQ